LDFIFWPSQAAFRARAGALTDAVENIHSGKVLRCCTGKFYKKFLNMTTLLIYSTRSYSNKKERAEILNIMKGIALFGIFILHVMGPFSGWLDFLSPEQKAVLPTAATDSLMGKAASILLAEKCLGIFSFLFGITLYYQLQKAERQGSSFNHQFLKRLSILFVAGLAHAYFFFSGDVLRDYAFCGLFLLVVYKWPAKRILIQGMIFLLVLPVIFMFLSTYFPAGGIAPRELTEIRSGLMGYNYIDLIKSNIFMDLHLQSQVLLRLQVLSVMLGQFLIGYWAGKSNLFSRLDRVQYKFVWIFWLCLSVVALRLGFTYAFSQMEVSNALFQVAEAGNKVFTLLGTQAITGCYVCGITLAFKNQAFQKGLLWLAPVGRMSLSIYLLQSIIGAYIFYGVGLGYFGKIGPTFSIPLAVLLFGFQALLSHYWLGRFKFGPFEWLVRFALNWNPKVKSLAAPVKVVS
jgi:uncharacterized protein